MNSETTKIKEIARLPVDERQRVLEAAAERAVYHYETDKELTTFTELDGVTDDWLR
jgi:hypothetical protein